MTANVKNALDKICHYDIFNDVLYFTGGTALAYYLNHRVSEDIDIVSAQTLNHANIISNMRIVGAKKLEDENVVALRLAGLVPDEYLIKFVLDNVKLEFFQANRPIQKAILSTATFTNYVHSNLKILDLKSVAKLKIVALIMRDKSRDLFDFGAILNHKVLSIKEIVDLFCSIHGHLSTKEAIVGFIQSKKEPRDDEAVYINEKDRINLSFEEIKAQVIHILVAA